MKSKLETMHVFAMAMVAIVSLAMSLWGFIPKGGANGSSQLQAAFHAQTPGGVGEFGSRCMSDSQCLSGNCDATIHNSKGEATKGLVCT